MSLFLICLGKALVGVKLFLLMKKSKSEGDCVLKFLQVTSLEKKLKDFSYLCLYFVESF